MEDFTVWLIEGVHDWWKHAYPWLSTHGISIVVIVITASVIKSFGAKITSEIIARTVRKDLFPTHTDREKRIKTLNSLVHASFSLVVYIIAGLLIVSELKPSYATALFASAGVLGVAVGFGAQSLIKDFTSGVFIIIENQYRVGDIIAINNLTGTVEAISIRTTTLRDLSGNVHHIPNGSISTTTNKTMGFGRLNEDIIVNNKTSIALIEKVIKRIDKTISSDSETKECMLEPISVMEISGYSAYGLKIKITCKTLPGKQWLVRDVFYRELKKEFEKEKIAFPPIPVIPQSLS